MNNSFFCTSSIVEISVKTDELYQRYVFMDEYEITKRKYLFFKKNIKIDRGFVWDEHLDNRKHLKNNDTDIPYIIEDGNVYDDYENMNAYAKENAEFFMHNKNNRFIGYLFGDFACDGQGVIYMADSVIKIKRCSYYYNGLYWFVGKYG